MTACGLTWAEERGRMQPEAERRPEAQLHRPRDASRRGPQGRIWDRSSVKMWTERSPRRIRPVRPPAGHTWHSRGGRGREEKMET